MFCLLFSSYYVWYDSVAEVLSVEFEGIDGHSARTSPVSEMVMICMEG